MHQGHGEGGPLCSGEAQERGSMCSMDHPGEKWDLGLGEGVTLKISQARSSGVGLSLWVWEEAPGSLRIAGENLEARPVPEAVPLPAILP